MGNPYVVMNVLDELVHPIYGDKRDLVGVIAGLIAHLTPEQALALVAKLPALLPAEAAAKLAPAAPECVAANGSH